jgi:8-oxo-dGTP diphosphatase
MDIDNFVSVDCVIFGYDSCTLKVLLLERMLLGQGTKNAIFSDKILPGSHIGATENLEDAAHRILFEYTGIVDIFLNQFKTFGAIDRLTRQDRDVTWLRTIGQDPYSRVMTVGFYSLINANEYKLSITKQQTHPEIFEFNPAWYDIKEIPKEFAYDHKTIMHEALAFLREGVKYNPLVFELLPEKFSLVLLQKIYETILGTNFDKRNFRRKFLKMPFIIPLNEKEESKLHKPSRLYRFDKSIYLQLKKNSYDIML